MKQNGKSATNPMRALRYAIKPTQEQRANRHWRDTRKDYLLQRELAVMIPCSVSCIRECEREKRFPAQKAAGESARNLYRKFVR